MIGRMIDKIEEFWKSLPRPFRVTVMILAAMALATKVISVIGELIT